MHYALHVSSFLLLLLCNSGVSTWCHSIRGTGLAVTGQAGGDNDGPMIMHVDNKYYTARLQVGNAVLRGAEQWPKDTQGEGYRGGINIK